MEIAPPRDPGCATSAIPGPAGAFTATTSGHSSPSIQARTPASRSQGSARDSNLIIVVLFLRSRTQTASPTGVSLRNRDRRPPAGHCRTQDEPGEMGLCPQHPRCTLGKRFNPGSATRTKLSPQSLPFAARLQVINQLLEGISLVSAVVLVPGKGLYCVLFPGALWVAHKGETRKIFHSRKIRARQNSQHRQSPPGPRVGYRPLGVVPAVRRHPRTFC